MLPNIPNLFNRIDLRLLYPEQAQARIPFTFCPRHEDRGTPNLAIYERNAYCFACGYIESALEHIARTCGCTTRYETMRVAEKLLVGGANFVKAPIVAPLPPLDVALVANYKRAMRRNPVLYAKLLARYGLSQETLDAADVGYAGYAYTLPVYSLSGEPCNIRFRVDDAAVRPNFNVRYWGMRGYQSAPAWYLPPQFRGETLHAALHHNFGTDLLYITEGEFDALALYQIGLPAISGTYGARSLVSSKSEALLPMLRGLSVVLVYDQDEAGRAAAHAALPFLLHNCWRVYNVTWDLALGKDASSLLASGFTGVDIKALIKEGLDKVDTVWYNGDNTTGTNTDYA